MNKAGPTLQVLHNTAECIPRAPLILFVVDIHC